MPVIAVYVWYRLAKYKFSLVMFLFVLLTGASAFFPALVLQDILNFSTPAVGRLASGQWELFYHVFIRIAFTEELSRLLVLVIFFLICRRIRTADSVAPANVPLDGSTQSLSWNDIKRGAATGLVAGLGFAVLENAVYAASDTGVLLLRAVTAAPLHAACGSRIGAAAVMLRSSPFQAILRLLTATAIHGIYNFLAAIPGIPSIAAVLIAFTALASSIMTIRGGWEQQRF